MKFKRTYVLTVEINSKSTGGLQMIEDILKAAVFGPISYTRKQKNVKSTFIAIDENSNHIDLDKNNQSYSFDPYFNGENTTLHDQDFIRNMKNESGYWWQRLSLLFYQAYLARREANEK